MRPTEETVTNEYKEDHVRKYDQKVNQSNAQAMILEILIGVMIKIKCKQALQAFDNIIEKTREIIQPDRSKPINMKTKRSYAIKYKRL